VTAIEETSLPPNARIEAVQFDDKERVLRVKLRGHDDERAVDVKRIAALFGGRIRHESTQVVSAERSGIDLGGKLALAATTGIVLMPKKGESKSVVGEELHFALALRVDDVPEVWYLLAASFNFRKALGPEATYALNTNIKLFVKKLAAFAPDAVQDVFTAAMVGDMPLPRPLESLLDFFRLATMR